jgi:uncharacterized protein YdeI (BOF family)
MKKFYILFLVAATGIQFSANAQSTIADARAMGEGAVITVKGIVTNGAEFGPNLRYFQDNSGGLAAFSSKVSTVMPGDSIEITGTLKQYNNLLEIDPVDNVTVINSGNTLPEPAVIELASGFVEANEGVLVRVNGVQFVDAGDFSASSKNYDIEKGSTTKQVRINAGTDIAGTTIPSGNVDIIGVMGQFSSTSSTTGFQLLPRSLEDLVTTSTGVTSAKNISAVSVYPNPSNGNTTLYFSLNENSTIAVSLISIDGRVIHEVKNERMNKGENSINMNVSEVASGLYFVQIKTANGFNTQKLVIE